MYSVSVNNKKFSVERERDIFLVNGSKINWDISKINERIFHVIMDKVSYNLELIEMNSKDKTLILKINNQLAEVTIKNNLDLLLEKLGMDKLDGKAVENVKAPMPGLILDINIKPGSQVAKGEVLLVLEAMKMENTLKSPVDGTIKEILVQKGDSVEKNQVLIQF